jgi:hypothetical protein
MRTSAILIVAWLCFTSAEAQVITEKHLDYSGKKSVDMNIQIADSINLHTWNKNEVFVTASVNINDNKDNDGYVISFEEAGNSIVINGKFMEQYFKGRDNCSNESDIYWQVYIPEKTPFNIETINGNITIDGVTDEIYAKSISGFIDLAAPANKQADIKFSTITGTIYSNHKLAPESRHSGIPSVIRESLNNGGSPVTLETISGDIYFRKSN